MSDLVSNIVFFLKIYIDLLTDMMTMSRIDDLE